MNLHAIIRRPLLTEKSNIAREEENLATFAVDPRANKHEIRRAVEELFDVEVTVRMRIGDFAAEWPARFVRLRERIDPDTRTLSVVVSVDKPFTFVSSSGFIRSI